MTLLLARSREPFVPPYAWDAWVTGRYYMTPNGTGTSTSNTLGVGTLRATPFVIPSPVTLVRIGAEVTSGGDVGSKVRLGLYADDGTGRPGALVVDAGTIAGDSGAVQEITISTAVSPGIYWAAAAVQIVTTTQPTLRTQANIGIVTVDAGTSLPGAGTAVLGFAQQSVTGALPAAFSSTNNAGAVVRMFVKVG